MLESWRTTSLKRLLEVATLLDDNKPCDGNDCHQFPAYLVGRPTVQGLQVRRVPLRCRGEGGAGHVCFAHGVPTCLIWQGKEYVALKTVCRKAYLRPWLFGKSNATCLDCTHSAQPASACCVQVLVGMMQGSMQRGHPKTLM